MSTTEQQLKDLYSRQLAVEKDQLQQAYAAADAEYADKKKTLQKTTDENLNRTAVEAQRAAVNQAELHNAYGLSSGAAAQARLALENQRAADMAALRQSGQEQDAQLERQRAALAQQYQSEIRRAQQENDIALAEALYQDAKKKQDELDAYTLQYAQLMAEAGNYIPLLNYWKAKGVDYTEDDIALLMGANTPKPGPNATDDGGGFGAGFTIQSQTGGLIVDQDSILALGFGAISAEALNKLIEQGVVEEYVEDGKLKFRKTTKGGSMPYSKGVMPLG